MTKKTNHLPKYLQIKEYILDQIRSGKVKPDEKIMSEPKLAQMFGVNRLTARSSVTELVKEGYLTRVHGQGTFVRRPVIESSTSMIVNFLETMEKKGYRVETRMLHAETIPAPEFIQEPLQLDSEELVHLIRRLRSVNEEHIVVLETYIPSSLCPDLLTKDLEARSLYETLHTDYGLQVYHAFERLEAQRSTKETAEHLQIREGDAVLCSLRTTTLSEGIPVEYTTCWYRGDRYNLEMSLHLGVQFDET